MVLPVLHGNLQKIKKDKVSKYISRKKRLGVKLRRKKILSTYQLILSQSSPKMGKFGLFFIFKFNFAHPFVTLKAHYYLFWAMFLVPHFMILK